jgi:putative transposase
MRTNRVLIPLHLRDLTKWSKLDTSVLSKTDREWYLKMKSAIEHYAAGTSMASIKDEFGVWESSLRRALNRCLAIDTDKGEIFGFTALRYGKRIANYKRKKSGGGEYRGRGGHAGSFEMLLDKYPLIRSYIESEYLKDSKTVRSEFLVEGGTSPMKEAKISLRNLHNNVLESLRKLGVKKDAYPLNTNDCGYRSLCKYCENIRNEGTIEVVRARAGREAASRHNIGIGVSRLCRPLRPYNAMQMDYHKVDAASLIGVTNSTGHTMWFAVRRWHIGYLLEEKSGAVPGAYIALESNPSSDTALEIIDSALRPDAFSSNDPRVRFTGDGKALVVQLMPELAYQAFSSLKVDNGWANTANDVVNNLMDTFGCCVGFGPVRSWARRDQIEKAFGEATQDSLQRLPSTYGSGPTDPRKSDPDGTAYKYRILLTDLVSLVFGTIRRRNLDDKTNLEGSSPIQVLKHALDNPNTGFFHQPLPIATQKDMRLMYAVTEKTVHGNFEKGIRPYVKQGGWTYTNTLLSVSYHLVGKELVLYTNRRLCRIVHAVIKDTGEELGQLVPFGKWADSDMTLTQRTQLAKAMYTQRNHKYRHDHVTQYMSEQVQKLQESKGKKGSKTLALQLAASIQNDSRAMSQSLQEKMGIAEVTPAPSATSKSVPGEPDLSAKAGTSSTPFGILKGPPLKPVRR